MKKETKIQLLSSIQLLCSILSVVALIAWGTSMITLNFLFPILSYIELFIKSSIILTMSGIFALASYLIDRYINKIL